MFTNRFSFGEQILPDYGKHHIELSESMAWPMRLMLRVTNGYVLVTLIGASPPNHDFCFPLHNNCNNNTFIMESPVCAL